MRIFFAVTLVFAVSGAQAVASTVVATSCSASDVQRAIDQAGQGDVVAIPAGRCTWTSTVRIPGSKGITLKGAGADATTIVSGTSENGEIRSLSVHVTSGNPLTRVTGLTFDAALRPSSGMGDQVLIYGQGVDRFRVDNTKFANLRLRGILIVPSDLVEPAATGVELSGLVDHNTFECPLNANCHGIDIVASPSFDVAAPSDRKWGAPFERPVEYGSSKAIYIEDNTFNFAYPNDGCIDAFGGAQIVFRFNRVSGCTIGWHGNDSAAYRGVHWFEVYRNSVATNAASALSVIRSGVGFIFDNSYSTPGPWIVHAIGVYRARPETFIGPVGQCDGSSVYDGNVGSGGNVRTAYPSTGTGNSGWPCIDQPGWVFDADGGAGFRSYPIYVFNDKNNYLPVGVGNYEMAAGNIANYLVENRDYYVETAVFTGEKGVGRGPVASRPGSCVVGVGYWATDQGNWNTIGEDGVFYKCTSTNLWSPYYTPYRYPHPLATGASSLQPPTNLRIQP